jgi:hypothetical protein
MRDRSETVPLACNLAALPDPVRYRNLLDRLRSAISGSAELPDGYSYSALTQH